MVCVVRVCWYMVRGLPKAPCPKTAWSATSLSIMVAPTKPQAQLCSEACETIYQQGGAHFHLIESSCFSLRNRGTARCLALSLQRKWPHVPKKHWLTLLYKLLTSFLKEPFPYDRPAWAIAFDVWPKSNVLHCDAIFLWEIKIFQ